MLNTPRYPARLTPCLLTVLGFALISPALADPRTPGLDLSDKAPALSSRAILSERDAGFAYFDATEGLSAPHPSFAEEFAQAAEAGLLRVASHTFRPEVSGTEQAASFLTHVRLRRGDLPPVINISDLDGIQNDAVQLQFRVFLERVDTAYGRPAMLHVGTEVDAHPLRSHFADRVLWYSTPDGTAQSEGSRAFVLDASASAHPTPKPVPLFDGNRAELRQLLIPTRLDQRPAPRPKSIRLAAHRPLPRPEPPK